MPALADSVQRFTGSPQATVGSTNHLMAVSLPYVIILVIAAGLPEGLPPSSTPCCFAIALMLAIAEVKGVRDALTEVEYVWEVRLTRAFVGGSYVVGFLILAYEIWVRRCSTWWRTVRTLLTVCGTIRLAATILLRALGAGEDNYPPGRLTYHTSLQYNLACILFSSVVISIRGRLLLAELMGSSRVVLTLNEVPELPAAGSEAWRISRSAVSRSSRSDRLSAFGNAGSSQRRRVHFHLLDAYSVRSADSGRSSSSRSSRSSRSHRSNCSGHLGRVSGTKRNVAAPVLPPHASIRKRLHWRAGRLTMYPEDFARMNELG